MGNFCEAEILAIFMIKHQLTKICSHKNFSSKVFLLTSRAQCLRVADPVNRQKVDLFCHRSIEQTAEICCDLRSTRRTANTSSELAPFGMAGFHRQQPTRFGSTFTLYYAKFFSGVFVGDLQKFTLAKISRYAVSL